jgi:multicomponent Na+:H+ antiporter subunit E
MTSPSTRKSAPIAQALRRGALLAAVWLVLAGSGGEALMVGAITVPCATWLSLRLLPGRELLRIRPLIALFPRFARRSLLGASDVAWRALHPKLPIRPGTSEVAIHLPAGARVALGGELSLMPGSVAAGCAGDRLLVHVLDLDQDIEAAVREEERHVMRLLASTNDGTVGA